MEFARRTSGWFMPTLIALSLCYIVFLGRYVPGRVCVPGTKPRDRVVPQLLERADGMFGMVANISSTFVFMFILFGSFLLKSGAGDFIVRLASSVAGRYQGGAGHVRRGRIRPDGVGLRLGWWRRRSATGVITIPMMVRSGFSPRFAAGVEVGSVNRWTDHATRHGCRAHLSMASYTQIPYLTIVAVSVLPALLYFLTVAFFVRIEARRLQIPSRYGWRTIFDDR